MVEKCHFIWVKMVDCETDHEMVDSENVYFIYHLIYYQPSLIYHLTYNLILNLLFLENMAIGDYLDMKGPKGEINNLI